MQDSCIRLTCHRKYTHEETNGPSGQHNLLLRIISRLLLSTGPDANDKDEQVEEHNARYSGYINHSAAVITFCCYLVLYAFSLTFLADGNRDGREMVRKLINSIIINSGFEIFWLHLFILINCSCSPRSRPERS